MTEVSFRVTNPKNNEVYTLTKLEEVFDPSYNDALLMGNDTYSKQKKFFKELWANNADSLFASLSKHSPFVEKWLKTFRTHIAAEDWFYLSMIEATEFGEAQISFGHGGVYATVAKSNLLSQDFMTLWSKVKGSERKANIYGSLSGTWWGTYVAFWRGGINAYAGKKAYVLGTILSLNPESYTFSFETTTDLNDQLVINRIKVNIMLAYENRDQLYKHFEYSTKIFDVVGNRDSWLDKGEGNQTLYGVELEVSTDYKDKAIIDAFPEIFAFIKKDATITGTKANPGEIVTIPASMRKHKRNWAAFFKNLSEDMFDCMDKHTNGMHVHIDRKAFDVDTLHLKKFCWFFTNPVNHKFLIEISERDAASMAQYAKLVTAPLTSTKKHSFANADRNLRSQGRKTSLNLENSATVEVRLFKGIVSFASVIKNIEFCDALVEFAREGKFSDMNISYFMKWLKNRTASQYRTLRMCLDDMDFGSMLVEAEIESVIKSKGLTSVQVVAALNKLDIESRYIKFAVATFNETFVGSSTTTSFKDGKFVVIKQHTKFSKFNERVLGMYNRA